VVTDAAANCPQAASIERPRVSRTVACTPRSSSAALKASIASRPDASYGESVGLKGIRLTLNIRGASGVAGASSFASATACP
jgi:hypothetical protein